MLNNGADLNAIKELLGHENLAATQIYTHNTFQKLKSIHQQSHPELKIYNYGCTSSINSFCSRSEANFFVKQKLSKLIYFLIKL